MDRKPVRRVLLFLPAVLTPREREEHLARARESGCGASLEVWQEETLHEPPWRTALRIRRAGFDEVRIARGHEPLGYSHAKLTALLAGLPTEFEGRVWRRRDWVRNLAAIAIHHARLRTVDAVVARVAELLSRPSPAAGGD
ncbi:MAG: hypothetical protein QHJ73_06120, partial [Armatimonadota bacterium]|nr:hypothetical protein [Armatimonadota bacterium]